MTGPGLHGWGRGRCRGGRGGYAHTLARDHLRESRRVRAVERETHTERRTDEHVRARAHERVEQVFVGESMCVRRYLWERVCVCACELTNRHVLDC